MSFFNNVGVETSVAGMIQMFAGANAPSGWLSCNGSAVSREEYPGLFDAIGTTYGIGDGSTTFNLPNLAGRVPIGVGQSTFASSFANTSVNITDNSITIASNDSLHTGTAVVLSSTGTVIGGLTNGTAYYVIRVSATNIKLATNRANAVAGTAIDITSQGTGIHTLTATLTNRTLGAVGGEEEHALTINEMPSHNHSVETVQTASQNAMGGGDVRANSTMKNTNSTGGSQSHNNMMPYIVMNYIIKY